MEKGKTQPQSETIPFTQVVNIAPTSSQITNSPNIYFQHESPACSDKLGMTQKADKVTEICPIKPSANKKTPIGKVTSKQ